MYVSMCMCKRSIGCSSSYFGCGKLCATNDEIDLRWCYVMWCTNSLGQFHTIYDVNFYILNGSIAYTSILIRWDIDGSHIEHQKWADWDQMLNAWDHLEMVQYCIQEGAWSVCWPHL